MGGGVGGGMGGWVGRGMGGLVAEGWGDGVMGLRVGFINILVMYTDSLIVHYSTTEGSGVTTPLGIRPAKALILVRMDVIIATEARILADKIKRHPLCMARRHHLKMGAPTQGAYRERFLHPAGKERNSVYWKMTQQRNCVCVCVFVY